MASAENLTMAIIGHPMPIKSQAKGKASRVWMPVRPSSVFSQLFLTPLLVIDISCVSLCFARFTWREGSLGSVGRRVDQVVNPNDLALGRLSRGLGASEDHRLWLCKARGAQFAIRLEALALLRLQFAMFASACSAKELNLGGVAFLPFFRPAKTQVRVSDTTSGRWK